MYAKSPLVSAPFPVLNCEAKSAAPNIKVLFVEDDMDDYFLVKDLLENCPGVNYQVSWIAEANAAMEAIAAKEHDVCLMDYHLGNTVAFDLMRALDGKRGSAPVIILTNNLDPALDILSVKSGASDFLCKTGLSRITLNRCIQSSMRL